MCVCVCGVGDILIILQQANQTFRTRRISERTTLSIFQSGECVCVNYSCTVNPSVKQSIHNFSSVGPITSERLKIGLSDNVLNFGPAFENGKLWPTI